MVQWRLAPSNDHPRSTGFVPNQLPPAGTTLGMQAGNTAGSLKAQSHHKIYTSNRESVGLDLLGKTGHTHTYYYYYSYYYYCYYYYCIIIITIIIYICISWYLWIPTSRYLDLCTVLYLQYPHISSLSPCRAVRSPSGASSLPSAIRVSSKSRPLDLRQSDVSNGETSHDMSRPALQTYHLAESLLSLAEFSLLLSYTILLIGAQFSSIACSHTLIYCTYGRYSTNWYLCRCWSLSFKSLHGKEPTTSARAFKSDEITAEAVASAPGLSSATATAAIERASGLWSLASGTPGRARRDSSIWTMWSVPGRSGCAADRCSKVRPIPSVASRAASTNPLFPWEFPSSFCNARWTASTSQALTAARRVRGLVDVPLVAPYPDGPL